MGSFGVSRPANVRLTTVSITLVEEASSLRGVRASRPMPGGDVATSSTVRNGAAPSGVTSNTARPIASEGTGREQRCTTKAPAATAVAEGPVARSSTGQEPTAVGKWPDQVGPGRHATALALGFIATG